MDTHEVRAALAAAFKQVACAPRSPIRASQRGAWRDHSGMPAGMTARRRG